MTMRQKQKIVIILLRIGVGLTFMGHGYLAFMVKPEWIGYLQTVGFDIETAKQIMPMIGVIDFLIAFSALLKPFRVVILYAFVWAFLTALIRPLSGEPIWEFIERGANWTAPLALWVLMKKGD